jgi:hypothetical protein
LYFNNGVFHQQLVDGIVDYYRRSICILVDAGDKGIDQFTLFTNTTTTTTTTTTISSTVVFGFVFHQTADARVVPDAEQRSMSFAIGAALDGIIGEDTCRSQTGTDPIKAQSLSVIMAQNPLDSWGWRWPTIGDR